MSDTIYTPHQYQDELNDDDDELDPILLEENEDMTEVLHEDPHERKERFHDNIDGDTAQADDIREETEDLDQET